MSHSTKHGMSRPIPAPRENAAPGRCWIAGTHTRPMATYSAHTLMPRVILAVRQSLLHEPYMTTNLRRSQGSGVEYEL